MLVVACNTITVTCIDLLRVSYPTLPIIGTVPVVKTAATFSKNKRIGILSTTRTANSHYQKKLIEEFAKGYVVVNIGSNLLVPYIEKGIINEYEFEILLRKVLADFIKSNIDTLVLGSTHFPFIKQRIQKVMGDKVHILDSGKAIVMQTKAIIASKQIAASSVPFTHRIITTGDPSAMQKVIDMLIHEEIQVEHISLKEEDGV